MLSRPHLLRIAHSSSIQFVCRLSSLAMSLPTSHQAIEIPVTGDSSVLTISTVPLPSVQPTDLLVRTSYAGVNFIDTYHRSGIYPLRSKVIGMEGVGRVVAVGDQVTTAKVGDLVAWPATISSYAEYVAVPHDRAVAVPDGVSEQVACA
eukprot:gene32714-39550_t